MTALARFESIVKYHKMGVLMQLALPRNLASVASNWTSHLHEFPLSAADSA